jgi:hypothetical protein
MMHSSNRVESRPNHDILSRDDDESPEEIFDEDNESMVPEQQFIKMNFRSVDQSEQLSSHRGVKSREPKQGIHFIESRQTNSGANTFSNISHRS